MTAASVESVDRRDRRIVILNLAAVTVLAWLYLAIPTNEKGSASWSALDFGLMFAMWTVMMALIAWGGSVLAA